MQFKDRLKELRTINGFTQKTLAEYLHYGSTTIANYESGRNQPSIEDIIKIATALNTSTDYLLGFTDVYTPCLYLTEFEQAQELVLSYCQLSPKAAKDILSYCQFRLHEEILHKKNIKKQEKAERMSTNQDFAIYRPDKFNQKYFTHDNDNCISYLIGKFANMDENKIQTKRIDILSHQITNKFDDLLDNLLNWLNHRYILDNLQSMIRFCNKHRKYLLSRDKENPAYGFQIDIDVYSFFVKCHPLSNFAHFYIYGYPSEYILNNNT